MPQKYIIGTEYFVLSRGEDDVLPRLEGTYLCPEDANAKKAELHKTTPGLRITIESRTVFNTSESVFRKPVVNPTEAEPDEIEASA